MLNYEFIKDYTNREKVILIVELRSLVDKNPTACAEWNTETFKAWCDETLKKWA